MNKYYCPFCDPQKLKVYKTSEENIKCIACGDSLTKLKLIDLKKAVGLITIISFIVPLILLIISSFEESQKDINNSNTFNLVSTFR